MSAGDNLTPHNDPMLRMARAALPRGRYDLSPKQIIVARHMAHEGAALAEIAEALGWRCALPDVRKRLAKKYNIQPRRLRGNPHKGDLPYLHLSHSPGGLVTTTSFRPKQVRS